MSEILCKNCGKKITMGKSDYCSDSCQKSVNVLSSNHFDSPSTNTKKCLKCGIQYENKPSKFCSLECATAYSLIMGEIR